MNFKKKILFILLLAVLAMCLISPAGAQNTAGQRTIYAGEEIYAQVHRAVFYVRALDEDGTLYAAGTGFFISSDGYALTAAHVIKNAASVDVELDNGSVFHSVKIFSSAAAEDIALLKLPATPKECAYIPLAEAPPACGAALYAIGYPLKTTKIMTDGMVSAPEASINGSETMLMTASLVNGMSGGPIVDAYGCAVGIASGTLRTMAGISISPTLEQIRTMLTTVKTEG